MIANNGIQIISGVDESRRYYAELHWKLENGVLYIKEPSGWVATKVPVVRDPHDPIEDLEAPDSVGGD